jgi:orotidine-5'-phosphate decarboxylase
MRGSETCAEELASLNGVGKHVCIGLDTDLHRIPQTVLPEGSDADRVVAFNAAIIEATASIACAYKPNAAFYEALGQEGFKALALTIAEVRRAAPGVPVIVDAKRADIGSTNQGYVAAIFDELQADAITVHPYLGREAMAPFLARADVLIFVLARTSNPGAGEFQDLLVDGLPLYRHIARAVANEWNTAGNCGLVVGATYPSELALLRKDVTTTMPLLIPGVGAQGGDLTAIVGSERSAGSASFVINVSRSVLYASSDADFADAAGAEAIRLHDEIATLLGAPAGR